MKLPRRKFLRLVAGAAALPAIPRVASAALDYPTRPVHWIVGYPSGGGTDIFARLMAQSLSERLGQPFVVENRPGASNNIATEVVIRAPADGYTILETDSAAAINATLYDLNFNFIRDITLVGVIRTFLVMLVHPSVPAKTVPEFIAYAKANPGKITYGSGGVANALHVAAEMFTLMTGVNMTHVPYRGVAPAMVDLLGGQVQVLFAGAAPSLEYIRAGKVRALAVTTTTRQELLPDIPSMADFVPGYDASQWFAAGLRKSTSVEIVNKLNKEINAAVTNPTMKARLTDLGATAFLASPDEFGKFIADETEKWAKVIRAANIKAE